MFSSIYPSIRVIIWSILFGRRGGKWEKESVFAIVIYNIYQSE